MILKTIKDKTAVKQYASWKNVLFDWL